jgi:hypothetical protein
LHAFLIDNDTVTIASFNLGSDVVSIASSFTYLVLSHLQIITELPVDPRSCHFAAVRVMRIPSRPKVSGVPYTIATHSLSIIASA